MPNRGKVDEEDLARCLWTIGDVTRLRLLAQLPTSPDCCGGKNVSQLAEELDLTQSTISNHLARLRTLGIVRHTRQCRDVYYWIDPERAEQIHQQVGTALKLKSKPMEVVEDSAATAKKVTERN